MKRTRRRQRLNAPLAAMLVFVILFCVALFFCKRPVLNYGFAREVSEAEQLLRMKLIETAQGWLGSKEQNGSHQAIIDLYNQQDRLPQGYTVQYDDEWCATFVSTCAIQSGLTQIIPTECGCQRQIGLFQNLGAWEEADNYVPLPGDIIYYCNNNKDIRNDCTGWADHVGIVVGTSGNRIKVIEGNYGDKVGYRYLMVNATIIRGYALPDYASLAE